jgi:hypothetical protein
MEARVLRCTHDVTSVPWHVTCCDSQTISEASKHQTLRELPSSSCYARTSEIYLYGGICKKPQRWEEQHPHVAQALRQLAEAHAQQAPTFRTCLAYTRLTAQAALEALREQGYGAEQLPSPSTMAAVLNRMGFRLRKVVKAKPQKKIKETDAIFDNIKKKTRKPSHQDASNDGVSIVKRR